jgi:hypothetical protein
VTSTPSTVRSTTPSTVPSAPTTTTPPDERGGLLDALARLLGGG